MRTLAILAVALLLLACSSSTTPPEPPPGPGGDGGAVASLDPGKRLNGTDVEEVEEGPWTVRRMMKSAPTKDSGGLTGGRRRTLRGDAPDDEVAEGAVAKSGGAEPPGAPARHAEPDAGAAPAADFESGDAPAPSEDPAEREEHRSARGGGASGGGARPADPTPMRAGSTDDNEAFDAFLEFLARWSDREDVAGRYDHLDVRDRRHLRVLDARERPVPAARVTVVDERADRIVWTGTTYGDGRVPFYPRVASPSEGAVPVAVAPEAGYLVEVRADAGSRRVRWDGAGDELVVRLEGERPLADPVRLDVLFLIDTTGSMADEIARIKGTLLRVTERLRGLEREFDLHYAAVLYRDLGDQYVTKAHPFTGDIEAFAAALQKVVATGGGDMPESLNQGLAEAVGRMAWREDAAKVAFLVADAPPHMDYDGDVPYGQSLVAAVARGIRIHSVAASGLDAVGSLVFRQVAQFTRGKFIFIEYGSRDASAARHGVGGAVKSNNLDDIIFEQIRDEVARWGRN